MYKAGSLRPQPSGFLDRETGLDVSAGQAIEPARANRGIPGDPPAQGLEAGAQEILPGFHNPIFGFCVPLNGYFT